MKNLITVEYKEQRILTTEQLAEVYETDVKNIHMNFSNHKENFIEGKHYYYLEGEVLKEFKNSFPNDAEKSLKYVAKLYLWTERGANWHCKILDTDKAWQQFDTLIETYFRTREYVQNKFFIPQTMSEALRLAADLAEVKENFEKRRSIPLHPQLLGL